MVTPVGRHQIFERYGINPDITFRIQLHSFAIDQQDRRVICLVAKGLTQKGQGLAEILTRFALGLIGPQQRGQTIAAMRAVRFYGQIGQQCPGLVGGKVSDGLAVQSCMKRT
jgi:hypothetical protein